jgi:hypothetical protein
MNQTNLTLSEKAQSFRFTLAEFSGALADLGVMLPLVLGLISLNGMNATAAFVGIGLAYILTALVYRLPIPVQPLKSVSAIALAMNLAPVVIVTGAIWNALAFLGMGFSGLDKWVQKAFPKPVVRGIQLDLSYLTCWQNRPGLLPPLPSRTGKAVSACRPSCSHGTSCSWRARSFFSCFSCAGAKIGPRWAFLFSDWAFPPITSACLPFI